MSSQGNMLKKAWYVVILGNKTCIHIAIFISVASFSSKSRSSCGLQKSHTIIPNRPQGRPIIPFSRISLWKIRSYRHLEKINSKFVGMCSLTDSTWQDWTIVASGEYSGWHKFFPPFRLRFCLCGQVGLSFILYPLPWSSQQLPFKHHNENMLLLMLCDLHALEATTVRIWYF